MRKISRERNAQLCSQAFLRGQVKALETMLRELRALPDQNSAPLATAELGLGQAIASVHMRLQMTTMVLAKSMKREVRK